MARPEGSVCWPAANAVTGLITGDRTLVPALANIVINACDGAAGEAVTINCKSNTDKLITTIVNPINNASHFPKDSLGTRFIQSESGFGVGAVLSNATIEKYGGKVSWESKDKRIITEISLPLSKEQDLSND